MKRGHTDMAIKQLEYSIDYVLTHPPKPSMEEGFLVEVARELKSLYRRDEVSWIKEVMESTNESESPERYFYWAAISTISAVCRRNIYLDKYFYKLYPNIFVLLIGPSGLRKGVPISLAQKLVEKVHCTRVISGRGSIQGIVKDLAKAYTLPDSSIIKDAIGFLVSSEFDSMLVQDDSAFTLLTDLYDTHFKDDWKNIIKVAGTDHLKQIYLSLLGASNETNLAHAIPHNAVGGGFVARTVIVLEEKKRRLNPLTERPVRVPDYDKLSERLFKIANLKGTFTYSPEGKLFYEQWYEQFMNLENSDPTGTLERIHDTVLKVAMCISLSKKDELVLDKDDIEEAVEKCVECTAGMKRVFLGHGEHALAKPTAKVLKLLLTAPDNQLLRKKLLIALYGEADSLDLDRIMDTLVQSGAVESFNTSQGALYKMPIDVVNKYIRLRKEIQ